MAQENIKHSKSYLSNPGKLPLLGLTIGDLIEQTVIKYGDRPAVVFCDGNIRKTFAELKIDIDNLAGGLLSLGLTRGDRVGCWGPNSYFYYLSQMATWTAGLIHVDINPLWQTSEVYNALQKTGIKCLIIAEKFKEYNFYDALCSVIPEIRHLASNYLLISSNLELMTILTMESAPLPGTSTMDQIMKIGNLPTSQQFLRDAKKSIGFDDICSIIFTSGTTGKPKGVKWTHHCAVNQGYNFGLRVQFTEQDKLCIPVSLTHVFGSIPGCMAGMCFGLTCVFPSKTFEAKTTVESIAGEKCTVLYGTPSMHMTLLDVPNLQDYDLSSLRLGITGGATCPKELISRMKDHLNVATVVNGYGMTESGLFHSLPGDMDDLRSSTVGYPNDHMEVKLIGENGQIVPREEIGELCARGYSITPGYWEDPERTAEAIDSSRWLHTGDLMIMHESGHASIVGRIKDKIIVGGENVFPKEIEDILSTHVNIVESYSFGIPDDKLGEVVGVWIRVKEFTEMTESEVKNFCVGKMPFFKIPSHIIFVSDFPRSVSGKVQRNQLKDHILTKRHLEKVNNSLN